MDKIASNNYLRWIARTRPKILRKLIYPGFRLRFDGLSDWFLISLYILPSYFGVRAVFFDLTAVRFFIVLMLIVIMQNRRRRTDFLNLIFRDAYTPLIGAYMFIVVYTNIIHISISTIIYWFTNVVCVFYIVTYLVIYEYGVTKFIEKLKYLLGIIVFLGPLELVIGRSPFSFLNTLHKSIGANERFGSVRIIGNCTIPNGYAMYLCILLPLACYDCHSKKIDIRKNIILVLLVMLNVMLTGSRLSVGIMGVELAICFVMQNKKLLGRSITVLCILFPLILVIMLVLRNVGPVKSILLTFTMALDKILHTHLSGRFGADTVALNNSDVYRNLLFSSTIQKNWPSPFLGQGGNYNFHLYVNGFMLESIDNFYVGQFVTYAWPGLLAWIAMSASFLYSSVKIWFKNRDFLCLVISVSIVGYYISLWYLDQLQTFSMMMSIFGLVYAISSNKIEKE